MRIICTIDSRTNSTEADLVKLIESGMTDTRFNFSHIDYNTVSSQITYLKEFQPNIRVIQDLQGNKIRVSSQLKHDFLIKSGTIVYFSTVEVYEKNLEKRNLTIIPVSSTVNFSVLTKAKEITMNNALLRFTILEKGKTYIKAIVEGEGMIRTGKGINFVGIDREELSLTPKDKMDIIWGLKHNVDIICLSFVSTRKDIEELKEFTNNNIEENGVIPKIWAKIESVEGVSNIKDIIPAVDGIMIGRGDLFAEINCFEIPKIENAIIKLTKKENKEIIIATHILDSMRLNMLPTLPEIESVYDFVKRKVDSLMLAIEVSLAKDPSLVVKTLKNMIDTYE